VTLCHTGQLAKCESGISTYRLNGPVREMNTLLMHKVVEEDQKCHDWTTSHCSMDSMDIKKDAEECREQRIKDRGQCGQSSERGRLKRDTFCTLVRRLIS